MSCFPNTTTQIIISLEGMERSTATIKFLWDFIYFSGDKAEILQIKEIKTVYFVECVCLAISRLLCLWNFPGKDTVEGCHTLIQGIFLS